MIKNLILVLRPYQWVKNLFVFLPLFFGGKLMSFGCLFEECIVFASFCLMASAVYCFNDICDIKSDRLHPRKKNRPIASGIISVSKAYILMIICVFLSYMLIFSFRQYKVGTIISFYLLMNILYCLYLKRIAIIDVFIISLGFVFRVLVGGLAIDVALSHWIIMMTFLLSLFLALAKRRDDVLIFEKKGEITRKNVDKYNLIFLNQSISIIASVTIVCYVMYTLSEEVIDRVGNKYLYATSIFVLLGLIRYLQLTLVDDKSGSPTDILLYDRFIQACVFGWFVSFFIILYL